MNRIGDIVRFYALLDLLEQHLGGKQAFDDPNAQSRISHRGVYFFFEPGELRRESGEGCRVTRIGTHALRPGSRATLRNRLKQHTGGKLGGNHRGSIFRLLTGQALLTRADLGPCLSWGVKNDVSSAAAALGIDRGLIVQAERPIELAVSAYIQKMPFLWLDIGDEPGAESLRGLIERNAIALLSNYERMPIDAASTSWLGHSSNRPLVSGSGLWNQIHVNQPYDPTFLDVFDTLVTQQSH